MQEGQTVPVQTLVAVIETDKSAASTGAPVAAAQRAPAAPGAAVATAVKPTPTPVATSPVLPGPSPSSPVPPKGDGGVETAEERLRRKSTPLVRKIAAEHQVDISGIPGTGFAGRVTKQDILGFIERGVPAPPAPGSRLPAPALSGPVVHPVVETRWVPGALSRHGRPLVLPFAVVGLAAGWLADGLLANPIVGAATFRNQGLAAIAAAVAGAALGAILTQLAASNSILRLGVSVLSPKAGVGIGGTLMARCRSVSSPRWMGACRLTEPPSPRRR